MTKKVTAYGGGLIHQGGRLRQGATLDDPSLPDLPGSARRWPRVSPLGLGKWVRASSPLDGPTKCSRSAFILRHPVSQAQLLDPCSADSTGPPTRDPTWERGAQTLKGPSVALTAPQRGEAWPKVWLKLGAQRVRTENGRRTTYRCAARNTPKGNWRNPTRGCTTVVRSVPIGWDH